MIPSGAEPHVLDDPTKRAQAAVFFLAVFELALPLARSRQHAISFAWLGRGFPSFGGLAVHDVMKECVPPTRKETALR